MLLAACTTLLAPHHFHYTLFEQGFDDLAVDDNNNNNMNNKHKRATAVPVGAAVMCESKQHNIGGNTTAQNPSQNPCHAQDSRAYTATAPTAPTAPTTATTATIHGGEAGDPGAGGEAGGEAGEGGKAGAEEGAGMASQDFLPQTKGISFIHSV